MKISGFENIISIEKFEYNANIDAHEYCDFSCYVKEENIDSLVTLVDSDILFEDDDFKFRGHIIEISYSKDISGCSIEVKSIGSTYLFDLDKKNRIFQNEEKTLSDILSFMESMSEVKVEGDFDPVFVDVIYQDNETDWKFMCRLCKSIGVHIFVGNNVFIGKYGTNTSKKIEEKDCIDYKLSATLLGTCVYCQLKNTLLLGDKVDMFGKNLVVIEKRYVLENEKYYYRYILKEISEEIMNKEKNDVYIDAIVIDNNDPEKRGRLQVSFELEGVQDCMKDSPLWIERLHSYASKGLGTVFIPNVGDKVCIHICNGKAYVIGSVREEAYAEPYQDSNNKYLLLSDKVYVEYKEGVISLFNKGNKIEVSEENIIFSVGDKSTVVSEKDKVCVVIDKSVVEISSEVKVKADKTIIETKSEASITGNSVNIKGKSGVSLN